MTAFNRFWRRRFAALVVGAIGCGALPAAAHDPRASVSGSTTVTFGFSDGTPLAFAATRVYGPADSIPYLEATTDRAGRVSFLPDRDGTWRAEAVDGQGHHLSSTMSIAHGVPLGSGKGLPDGLVALSLVLNLILGSLLAGRRRERRGT